MINNTTYLLTYLKWTQIAMGAQHTHNFHHGAPTLWFGVRRPVMNHGVGAYVQRNHLRKAKHNDTKL